ncbi:pyridoxal-phosphate dependent enzyme [Cronobacter sakazakii]|nr:pyridoxal-phosphate dependent enzyme [Cronobacter sakazakii]MCZ6106444.1 pyridoxal-phosphate dependent enzyme [Cronobacter sakazakii]MCZ6146649.1 pyridoxal-phosphate dependent enzyme [Cronobacter sakazakii]MCZ6152537.1 pyridoxal-phosphate dependent enzyme [Cronobacter sakazakii]MCZ6410300.1 pyridoxal-phosphate dependent enzyme [Cronobacter sakazakii]
MSIVDSVTSLIGQTPLLRLAKLDTGPCELLLKLENQNPGGSIKDRVALSMINEAERQGRLAPGGTIIEATAGNTGLGLALIAAQKGYRLILVVPDKMSREKIYHLRASGGRPAGFSGDRRRRVCRRARSAENRRRAGGLLHRHAACRRAALLPRTDHAETRGDVRLRQRQ